MTVFQCTGHRNVKASSIQEAAEIFASRATKKVRFSNKFSLKPNGYPVDGGMVYTLQVFDNLGGVLYTDYHYGVYPV